MAIAIHRADVAAAISTSFDERSGFCSVLVQDIPERVVDDVWFLACCNRIEGEKYDVAIRQAVDVSTWVPDETVRANNRHARDEMLGEYRECVG